MLRLLLTGLLALAAMGAAVLAAIVVVLTAVFGGLTGGRVRGKVQVRRGGGPAASRSTKADLSGTRGDVIDVEATPVPEKQIENS